MFLLALSAAAALLVTVAPVTPPAEANNHTTTFIRGLVDAAKENQRTTGIPASVAIGMAALETGWGRSSMAQPPINSYFSIKCGTSTPHANGCVDVPSYEYDKQGNRYLQVSSFRTYATVGHSLLDFGRLLTTASRYAPAFQHRNNPDEFVRAVRRAGYATDPQYAETVIGIMKKYQLYQYDSSPGSSGPVVGPSEDWMPQQLRLNAPRPATIPEFVPGPDFPPYTNGSRKPGVRTLQLLLNQYNSAALDADAIFGPLTDRAVRDWQTRQDAKVTGVMDDEAWRSLVPTLSSGTSGGAVTALQHELTQAGFPVPVSGRFDDATVRAVRAFQSHHLIQPTGMVTEVVWARLLDW